MNETINLTPRQSYILNIITFHDGISRDGVSKQLETRYKLSKATLIRELNYLIKNNLILSEGNARSTTYYTATKNPLLRFIDLNIYFQDEPDDRISAHKSYNNDLYFYMQNLLLAQEQKTIQEIHRPFSKTTKHLPPDVVRKELERFVIELSWKSSKIEGNTYSLLDTETLIRKNIKAPGHSDQEAVMILNHKQAFDYILKHKMDFRKLSFSHIRQLHNILIKDLAITLGIRKHAVGITGTVYKPLDNQHQLFEAVERTLQIINIGSDPVEKALIAHAMIPYIQPFTDGNKRTGRMLTNAILLAYDYFPLSYRSVEEDEFKKALILFYEQNSLYHVKRLFIEQLVFAYETYFVGK
ncbi:Fic family protein [Candidatus Woesebacteria bacterium]|nr:Fic family protein [Candidatus Woesebacteria bacterium]